MHVYIWRCQHAMFLCGSFYAPSINSHVYNFTHSFIPVIMYINSHVYNFTHSFMPIMYINETL